ncbi:MAG TPA: hypothetical protein VEP90_19135 [Methylomirabilota bacterium]|nr:hypothetical protein [Methylomirabilota bacterium]
MPVHTSLEIFPATIPNLLLMRHPKYRQVNSPHRSNHLQSLTPSSPTNIPTKQTSTDTTVILQTYIVTNVNVYPPFSHDHF